ncbi:MAG: aminotransferase class III-fold pyridoxal phosphate-dependent enzyme [Spirochaetaceae bacterium]|nr:aminotransferase class III-fold pyridoxal phosphate-dependent enzyme [Spirochaetaceae bacterium]
MSIDQQYLDRHRRSAEIYRLAGGAFPGGVTHDTRFLQPFPLVMTTAAGSRKIDVDDNEYIDYVMGHGALLLGHSHPAVVAAVSEQLQRGTHLGGNTELELRWAEAVQRLMPSVERVRFHSSGTEATMMALRLARAHTGRPTVLRFKEHFHGWHDYAAAVPGGEDDPFAGPGIPAAVGATVRVIAQGDADLVDRTLAGDRSIGAVILEPTGAMSGRVPVAAEFVRDLRAITARHEVLLILDEVVTGFRVSAGGAQRRLGIRPDLTSMAKIVAGGLPGGAVGGRADILDQIALPGGRRRVAHPGTFNANPLSAAAGCTCLDLLAGAPLPERAEQAAARLYDGLNRVFADSGAAGFAYRSSSFVHVAPNLAGDGSEECVAAVLPELGAMRSSPAASRFRVALLNEGVDAMAGLTFIVSAVHDDADIDATVAAFGRALQSLRAEGVLHRRTDATAAAAAPA